MKYITENKKFIKAVFLWDCTPQWTTATVILTDNRYSLCILLKQLTNSSHINHACSKYLKMKFQTIFHLILSNIIM